MLRLTSFVCVTLLMTTSYAKADFTEQQQQAIRALVEATIMENPEIIINSFQAYQKDQQEQQAKAQAAAVKDVLPDILKMTSLPIAGNAKGDVTIIEFFDYNCGYCKRAAATTNQVVNEDKKVRWVMIDFPILSESSQIAARASLAAVKQKKHFDFHMALMGNQGALTEASIFDIAKKVGLNVDNLKKDMEDASITRQLAENRQLAERLQIRGTPAFIIGETLAPGAIAAEQMHLLIKQARGK